MKVSFVRINEMLSEATVLLRTRPSCSDKIVNSFSYLLPVSHPAVTQQNAEPNILHDSTVLDTKRGAKKETLQNQIT